MTIHLVVRVRRPRNRYKNTQELVVIKVTSQYGCLGIKRRVRRINCECTASKTEMQPVLSFKKKHLAKSWGNFIYNCGEEETF